MIKFSQFELENGLRVIHHYDNSTPIIAFNLVYDVGARDEEENKTGFAHLFEHLMFGGSINIPYFDTPLQKVGGENNAFTSNDITNYYITVPKQNVETAFWLESDRMLGLAFSDKSLEVQRQVVIEEFKQRYLNQPYGDVFLLLRPLAYKKHPYRWATIGKEISHIEQASMNDVKAFFNRFYHPGNAVLCVAGDISLDNLEKLTNKWFADIPKRTKSVRQLPLEEEQKEQRVLTVERDVPLNAFYSAYHMVERTHSDYFVCDLLSDILSRGNSSRLNRKLLKEKKLVAEINAYITADIDPGLFIISAKLVPGVEYDEIERVIWEELDDLKLNGATEQELKKVKNKVEATEEFAKTSILNKAMGLAIAAVIDDPDRVNTDLDNYKKVTNDDVKRVANSIFRKENNSVLYYKSKHSNENN